MPKSKRKVLLLGGTGAMGVYLAPELNKLGFEVHVTSRRNIESNNKNIKYIQGNAKDMVFISDIVKNKYDAIVDFMVYRTNEFRKRLNILLDNTEHYVFLSSYRVYAGSDRPMNESSPRLLDVIKDKEYISTDEYGLTKARQENILINSNSNSWTIVRPAITYSKERFQLGTLEAGEFLYRAINGKEIIFPQEMLPKKTTMTWAGDVAKMISKLINNKKAYNQIYTVSTSENHTWKDVLDIYKNILDIRVKLIPLVDYQRVIGRPYQIKYDRMYDRLIDNSKVLQDTGIKQDNLVTLEDGLKLELGNFLKKPKFNTNEINNSKNIDKYLAQPNNKNINIKQKVRKELKKVKVIIRNKLDYDGAILSLGGYYNYGGLIQRYALQTFLKNSGYNFKIFKLSFMNKFGDEKGNRKGLERFAQSYLTEEKFRPTTGGFYKYYIVGSDQVWRDWYGGNWNKFGIFFLSFVKNRKAARIAYSASFGKDDLASAGINASNRKKIRKLIQKFDSISVREKSSMKLVEQLHGKADVAVDPTLLLHKEDYSKLIECNKVVNAAKTKPIYTYLLDATEPKMNLVERIKNFSQKQSTNLITLESKELPSVEYWLKGFRDCEIVITDSYHGIVFAIINNKQFIAFGNKSRGLSRMIDLLEPLGLEDRIIDEENIDEVNIETLLLPINWAKVEEKLSYMRKESSRWLVHAIENKA